MSTVLKAKERSRKKQGLESPWLDNKEVIVVGKEEVFRFRDGNQITVDSCQGAKRNWGDQKN